MHCKEIYDDYYLPEIYSSQQEESNQGIELLQQLIDDEQEDGNDPKHQPWISEICFSVHRKTGFWRRFFNHFYRSKRSILTNVTEEFVRKHNGHFNHPIGYRFYMSYAKEKWVLTLKDLKVINYPFYPYPRSRIILIHKNISYISR